MEYLGSVAAWAGFLRFIRGITTVKWAGMRMALSISVKMIHGMSFCYAEDEDDSEPSLEDEDELLDDELDSPPLLLLSPGWATSPGSRRG